MKPRIWKSLTRPGKWCCCSTHYARLHSSQPIGMVYYGLTPRLAYLAWELANTRT